MAGPPVPPWVLQALRGQITRKRTPSSKFSIFGGQSTQRPSSRTSRDLTHRPPITPGVSREAKQVIANRGRSSGGGGGGGYSGGGGGGGGGFGGPSVPSTTMGPGGPLGGLGGLGINNDAISNEVRDLLELELGPARRQLERELQSLVDQGTFGSNQINILQGLGTESINQAFGAGRTATQGLQKELGNLIGLSQGQRQGITGNEAATLAAIDQIQKAEMTQRLADFNLEQPQSVSEFQGGMQATLSDLLTSIGTESADVNQQLLDLETERGILGSQLRRELNKEAFERGRVSSNDAFDQAMAQAALQGSNLDRILDQARFGEDIRQFDLSFALEREIARQNQIKQQREEEGGLVGRPALIDFLTRGGTANPTGVTDAFYALLGGTAGDTALMGELLRHVSSPSATPDDRELALNELFSDILSRYRGSGARNITAQNVPALIDALLFYSGG